MTEEKMLMQALELSKSLSDKLKSREQLEEEELLKAIRESELLEEQRREQENRKE